jgi:hypothetical protein
MALQKTKEGPKEGPHNQSLKNAIKYLRSIGDIDQAKDIVDRTKYHKSTVSEYIRGIEPASSDFEKEFEKQFGISLEDFKEERKDNNYKLSTKGVNITLQDYINLLHRQNDQLYSLLNSTLGRIHDDTHTSLAYQKAWVRYEAERMSEGDNQKEAEIRYKMSKLVDDELKTDGESGNPGEIDK